MKRILTILLFFISVKSIGQSLPPTPGISSRSTLPVEDRHLFARQHLGIPRYNDTAQANTYIGIDTLGSLIYTYDWNGYWFRAFNSNGTKYWRQLTPGGTPTTDTIAWNLGGNRVINKQDSAIIGTIDNFPWFLISNNRKRLGLANDGIHANNANVVNLGRDTITGYLSYGSSSGGSGINIYNSDGSLTGTRNLYGANTYNLTFDSLNFRIIGVQGTGQTIPSYAGAQMFFYPRKSAFRAGTGTLGEWDDANVGTVSTAFGNNNIASGASSMAWGGANISSNTRSTAFGSATQATGLRSTSWGNTTLASGSMSTAWGNSTTASGGMSTAWGSGTLASGTFYSTAWGSNSQATALIATAWGDNTLATGINSTTWGSHTQATDESTTAWGNFSQATGEYSTAWGDSSFASGETSSAWGQHIKEKHFAGTAIGTYNDSTNATSATSYNALNRAFQIGVGTADNARANALTILFSGKTTLNKYGVGTFTGTPTYNLQVNSSGDIIEGNIPASGWGLTGNSGTSAGTNFVGTTDAQNLILKSNSTTVLTLAATEAVSSVPFRMFSSASDPSVSNAGDIYYNTGSGRFFGRLAGAYTQFLMTGDVTAGANTALSNLASVAINTSLISDTDNTDDLGGTSIRWRNAYLAAMQVRFNSTNYHEFTQDNANLLTIAPQNNTVPAVMYYTGQQMEMGLVPFVAGNTTNGYPGAGYNFSPSTSGGVQNYRRSGDPAYRINFGASSRIDIQTAVSGTAPNPITWDNRMTILQSNGNVGINNTSPTSKLHISGSLSLPIRLVTADLDVITADDHTLAVENDGNNWTETLPDAATCFGRIYLVTRANSSSTGKITVASAGGDVQSQNDGVFSPTYDILDSGEGLWGGKFSMAKFQSDGINWRSIK